MTVILLEERRRDRQCYGMHPDGTRCERRTGHETGQCAMHQGQTVADLVRISAAACIGEREHDGMQGYLSPEHAAMKCQERDLRARAEAWQANERRPSRRVLRMLDDLLNWASGKIRGWLC